MANSNIFGCFFEDGALCQWNRKPQENMIVQPVKPIMLMKQKETGVLKYPQKTDMTLSKGTSRMY